MSETKHTSEPWEVRGLYICASTDTYIAKMLHGDNLNPPDQETYGNANLIAAAPDMLAALEAASAAMLTGDGDWSHEETEAYDIIDAAIAKAKGGSK